MPQENEVDRIDAILDDAVRRIRSGEVVDTAEYCRTDPDLADEIQLLLPAILLLERPPLRKTDSREPLPSIPGYHMIREIGRGGMGIVYEAVQKQLNRRVALKVIRVGSTNRVQTSRFCREASTAAGLQHPNIVPVFDFGEAEGLAYYSMQLIEGNTLDQMIKGARISAGEQITRIETLDAYGHSLITSADTGSQQQFGSNEQSNRQNSVTANRQNSVTEPELTASVMAILQVAEALAYAHDRGVLHRDIKPSNIIVDPQGKAWITDFGLAWHIGAESLTADGDIVGTVRYLAPEGFSGQSSAQSDIYSLGLTLYELLEGRPAFTHMDRGRLIAEILNGNAPELTAAVPSELATICSTCTQKRAKDRYASAALLATDLKSFLEQRPITAKRIGKVWSILRWCEQNRALTVLSIVSVLCLTVGTYAVIENRSSSKAAKRLEEQSRVSSELARTNLRMLLNTVDRFCQTVTQERRLYSPEFKQLRDLLRESAASLNTQLGNDPSASPDAKLQLAGVQLRLGKLGSTDNTLAESEAHLLESQNLLLGLLRDKPSEQTTNAYEIELELIGCYQELGATYSRMNRIESSKTKLEDSIEVANGIIRDCDDKSLREAAQFKKSRSLSMLGRLCFELREFELSESHFDESIQLLQELAKEHPDDLEISIELADQWTGLATMRTANLRVWRQAETPFMEAAAVYLGLRQQTSNRPDLDFSYAVLLRHTAKWLYMSKQLSTAIETQRTANEILEKLAEDFDYDLAIQLEFGLGLRQYSGFLIVQDAADPEILKVLERSEAVLSGIVARDSSDVVRVMALVNTCQTQADVLQRQGQFKEALVANERAISALSLILNDNPQNAGARESRYFAAVARAELLTELERYQEALTEWDLSMQFTSDAFAGVTAMKRTRTEALSGDYLQASQRAETILSQESADGNIDRRVISGAAQTFAIAARMHGLTAPTESEPAPGEPFAERAVDLVKQYLATNASARDYVSTCEDFNCLRSRPDFVAALQHSGIPAP
ncbi:MAG: serine/threonine protein kinase [Planctomyces sp.]|nr:serine/threonine protein kinase [Planctomyces sp.]